MKTATHAKPEQLGEHKANMLRWLGYGAAARIPGKCDDARSAKRVEAFALDAESSYGPGQLPEDAGPLPIARGSTPPRSA